MTNVLYVGRTNTQIVVLYFSQPLRVGGPYLGCDHVVLFCTTPGILSNVYPIPWSSSRPDIFSRDGSQERVSRGDTLETV